jgi:hypothetical protein
VPAADRAGRPRPPDALAPGAGASPRRFAGRRVSPGRPGAGKLTTDRLGAWPITELTQRPTRETLGAGRRTPPPGVEARPAQAHLRLPAARSAILGRSRRDRVTAFAARYQIPALYHISIFPAVGGLASYGADIADVVRRQAFYVHRILMGEKPSDLPIQPADKLSIDHQSQGR